MTQIYSEHVFYRFLSALLEITETHTHTTCTEMFIKSRMEKQIMTGFYDGIFYNNEEKLDTALSVPRMNLRNNVKQRE